MKIYMIEYEYYDKFDIPQWQQHNYLILDTEIGFTLEGDCRDDFFNGGIETSQNWMADGNYFRNIKTTYIGKL